MSNNNELIHLNGINYYPQDIEQAVLVEKKLQKVICEVISIDMNVLHPNKSLLDFNLTSVQSVEIVLSLQKQFDCQFPPAFVHDYSSLEQMKRYILGFTEE